MSFTVYQTNKKTGVVYAYLQTAFRDPVTKRPKSKRTYLGRVDPVSGEVVPKEVDGKRNRSKLGEDMPLEKEKQEFSEDLHNQADLDLIESQRKIIEKLTTETRFLREALSKIHRLSSADYNA